MNKPKNNQIQGTFGPMEPVEDFLPKPEDLVLKEDVVKVTMNLEKSSIDFFKSQAKQFGTSYQRMIRNLVNHYATTHQQKT